MFGIDDAVTAVSKLIDDGITRIWPDATEIEKAKIAQITEQTKAEMSSILAQLEINKVEAASPHWFVAAGRPAAIWVGVSSLLYSGIGVSFGTWIAACFGLPPIPMLDPTTATNLLYALLGVSGLRTIDKVQGVATNRMTSK
jgi:hypothetical protein